MNNKPHSQKTKNKISKAMKGKKSWKKGLSKETDMRVLKSALKQTKREYKECIICKKLHLNKKYCSIKCSSEGHKERPGTFTGKHHSQETIEKNRQKHLGKPAWNKGLNGDEYKDHYKNGMGGFVTLDQSGNNHYNWKGGISFEQYGIEFNNKLKSQIKKRDNHTCQKCLMHNTKLNTDLVIHHIDENKKNNDENNLITLCRRCHGKIHNGKEIL